MINIDISKKLHGSSNIINLDINLNIKTNDFIALTGPSGSGKTTLLRILAGIESSCGNISVNNTVWQDNNTFVIPQKRDIGFVFQDYALFPNMTIKENLLFVQNDINLANRLLNITQLSNLEDKMPNNLSGGQKQRVALCRALMNKPKLLLMDEPLSALDNTMRENLQNMIKLFHKEFNLTTIIVSHDISEIYQLASRVLVLDHGKIIDDGIPKDILFKNKSILIGNILDIEVTQNFSIVTLLIGKDIIKKNFSNKQIKNLSIGDNINLNIEF